LTRLVVFDLDGTLVDSRRDLADAANDMLRAYGCPTHPEDAIGRMVGDGAATLVRRAFAAANCPQPADALERFLGLYNARLLKFTRPYPGMLDVLDTLERRALLAVLTNKPIQAARAILGGLELARYFGQRVCGGDGPHPRKPDPTGLQQLMAAAGMTPEETVLVGDSVVDWRTARAATTGVCLARYGFGFAGFPLHELHPDDRVIDNPNELLAVL
jgi:phosphoglycolate phosphatase